jgi:PAS domain S-box-containing protein
MRPGFGGSAGSERDTNLAGWKWKLGSMHNSRLLRYGTAAALAIIATVITLTRDVMLETPFFLFLGAVALSAIYGGLGPGFTTAALSLLLIRWLFPPEFARYLGERPERIERLAAFVLVTLMVSSMIAALRRERNLLRESEDLCRTIADITREAVILIDPQGLIVWVNRAALRMFAPGERLLGTHAGSVIPEECWCAELSAVAQHLECPRESVVKQVTVPGTQERSLVLEVRFSALQKAGRDVLALMARDVTRYVQPQPSAPRI